MKISQEKYNLINRSLSVTQINRHSVARQSAIASDANHAMSFILVTDIPEISIFTGEALWVQKIYTVKSKPILALAGTF